MLHYVPQLMMDVRRGMGDAAYLTVLVGTGKYYGQLAKPSRGSQEEDRKDLLVKDIQQLIGGGPQGLEAPHNPHSFVGLLNDV